MMFKFTFASAALAFMTPRTLLEINTSGEICLGEHDCTQADVQPSVFVGTKECAIGCDFADCCKGKVNGAIPGKTPSTCAAEAQGETNVCEDGERFVEILDCLLPNNCEPADCCMTDDELNEAGLLELFVTVTKELCGDQPDQGECEGGQEFDGALECTPPCLDATECCVDSRRLMQENVLVSESESETESENEN